MHHQHFQSCPSTQAHLKDNWQQYSQNYSKVLITTEDQTSGVGRRGNQWLNVDHALAFSFSLNPSNTMTLTSLELGIHLCNFYQDKVSLKWPNDLLNSKGQKCGGIICNLVDQNVIIAGIGLNMFLEETPKNDFKIAPGGIFDQKPIQVDYKKLTPLEIVEEIHNNRMDDKDILEMWNNHCVHLDKPVRIVDQSSDTSGIFRGIGPQGEALIETNGNVINIMSGSLFFE